MTKPGYNQNFSKNLVLLRHRYKILQPLAAGGFGNTYLAEDLDLPSHPKCVIKQLRPVFDTPEVARIVHESFEREAIVLEQLGNENSGIPNLYAYFKEDLNLLPQYYLVQEWIEGYTITQQVSFSGPLPEEKVVQILAAILKILVFLQNHDIIHRDIKPDNIILRSDEQPVLIDFGAVKQAVRNTCKQQTVVVGTPGFMPMEQMLGNPDFTSDIFALGMTAIFMLTGKIPQDFQIKDNKLDWEKHTSASLWITQILNKATASIPQDRFSDPTEMLDALSSPSVNQEVPRPLQSLISVLLLLSAIATLLFFLVQK